MKRSLLIALLAVWTLGLPVPADEPSESELDRVRARVRHLEERLKGLERQTSDARAEQERLSTEVELAEARVEELEAVLTRSRDRIVALREEVGSLSAEMEVRRKVLSSHLEMLMLLGRPGPLQLLYDAAVGGDLEQAVSTVAVLTSGQARLLEEYDSLQKERSALLAELSQVMNEAGREAQELVRRRRELESVRAETEVRVRRLEQSSRSARNDLIDMRERQQALERLMGLLAERRRPTGRDDIRRYRGALPWPANGTIAESFGRHHLETYDAYTVCNGLRLTVAGSEPVGSVFPGVVAFAKHFKGYGNMVVVDHGHDVYSVVGGLATILVRLDEQVSMGSRLGLTPPPGSGGNLYVEIRVGGKPQDPRRWLTLREG